MYFDANIVLLWTHTHTHRYIYIYRHTHTQRDKIEIFNYTQNKIYQSSKHIFIYHASKWKINDTILNIEDTYVSIFDIMTILFTSGEVQREAFKYVIIWNKIIYIEF